jgi:hypothetical protein
MRIAIQATIEIAYGTMSRSPVGGGKSLGHNPYEETWNIVPAAQSLVTITMRDATDDAVGLAVAAAG